MGRTKITALIIVALIVTLGLNANCHAADNALFISKNELILHDGDSCGELKVYTTWFSGWADIYYDHSIINVTKGKGYSNGMEYIPDHTQTSWGYRTNDDDALYVGIPHGTSADNINTRQIYLSICPQQEGKTEYKIVTRGEKSQTLKVAVTVLPSKQRDPEMPTSGTTKPTTNNDQSQTIPNSTNNTNTSNDYNYPTNSNPDRNSTCQGSLSQHGYKMVLEDGGHDMLDRCLSFALDRTGGSSFLIELSKTTPNLTPDLLTRIYDSYYKDELSFAAYTDSGSVEYMITIPKSETAKQYRIATNFQHEINTDDKIKLPETIAYQVVDWLTIPYENKLTTNTKVKLKLAYSNPIESVDIYYVPGIDSALEPRKTPRLVFSNIPVVDGYVNFSITEDSPIERGGDFILVKNSSSDPATTDTTELNNDKENSDFPVWIVQITVLTICAVLLIFVISRTIIDKKPATPKR